MSRDPEYQADRTKSIIFQWENGAMSDTEALEMLSAIYKSYEPRRRA